MDWSFLKFGVKFMYLIENITVAILLQITELLMEPVYICECNNFRVWFVWMYILIPAFAFSVFAWSLRQGNIFMEICKCRGENSGGINATDNFRNCMTSPRFLFFCKTLYPAFCWCVIILIDGKYLACGLYSKCSSTMTKVNMTDPEMVHGMMKSKISGLGVVFFSLLGYIFYLVYGWCQSHEDRYKAMYMSQLEEDREKFAREYAKKCLERRHSWCEKELKKAGSQPGAENPTSSGAGNPTSSGAENPTSSGAKDITPSGDENPTSSGAKDITPSGAESTAPSGAESTAPSGAESTAPSGAESTAPSGAESPAPSGAGSTAPSAAESTAPSGAESPAPSGAESTEQSGARSTAPSGAESTEPSGAESTAQRGAVGGDLTFGAAKIVAIIEKGFAFPFKNE